jgi:hypothetical protein
MCNASNGIDVNCFFKEIVGWKIFGLLYCTFTGMVKIRVETSFPLTHTRRNKDKTMPGK